MTKDYAKRRRSQHHLRQQSLAKKRGLPAYVWMGAGLLLGVGLSALLYWKLHKSTAIPDTVVDIHEDAPKELSIKKSNKPKQSVQLAKVDELPKGSSRFDFYTVLPKMNQKGQATDPQVAATDTLDMALHKDLSKAPQTALIEDDPDIRLAEKVTTPPPPAGKYFIQAGSFRRLEQAEGLKAQLAMSGFEARIQTFKMGDRDNRYRVIIGPYSSKDQAQNQQMHLEQALQLHSVVLKITV